MVRLEIEHPWESTRKDEELMDWGDRIMIPEMISDREVQRGGCMLSRLRFAVYPFAVE